MICVDQEVLRVRGTVKRRQEAIAEPQHDYDIEVTACEGIIGPAALVASIETGQPWRISVVQHQ